MNTLELIESAAAITLFDTYGNKLCLWQIKLRGNNSSTSLVANTRVVYSPSMRMALRIFDNECQNAEIMCWTIHQGTKANHIADYASCMDTAMA